MPNPRSSPFHSLKKRAPHVSCSNPDAVERGRGEESEVLSIDALPLRQQLGLLLLGVVLAAQAYGKRARILSVNGCFAPIYTQNSVAFFSGLSSTAPFIISNPGPGILPRFQKNSPGWKRGSTPNVRGPSGWKNTSSGQPYRRSRWGKSPCRSGFC
jgi:hypothetical protein